MATVTPMPYAYCIDGFSLASSPPPTSHSSLLLYDADQNAGSFHKNGLAEAFPQKVLPTPRHLLRRTSSVYSHRSTSVLEGPGIESHPWLSSSDLFIQPEQLRHSTPNLTTRPSLESVDGDPMHRYLLKPVTMLPVDGFTLTSTVEEETISAEASRSSYEPRYWVQPNWTNFEPLFKSPRTPPKLPRPEEDFGEASSCAPSHDLFADSPVMRAVDMAHSPPVLRDRAGCQDVHAASGHRVDATPFLEVDARSSHGQTGHRRRSNIFRMLPKGRDSERKSKPELSDRHTGSSECLPLCQSSNHDPRPTEGQNALEDALKTPSTNRSGNIPGRQPKEATRLVPAPTLPKLTTPHNRAYSTNSIRARHYRNSEKLKGRACIGDMLRHVREGDSFHSYGSSKGGRGPVANRAGKITPSNRSQGLCTDSSPRDKKSVTFLETSRAVSLMSSRVSSPSPSANGSQGRLPRLRASTGSLGFKDRLANSVHPVFASLTSSIGGLKRAVGTSKSEKRREDLKKSIRMVEGSFR